MLVSYDVSLEVEVWSSNMTSNVAPMWRKAGANLAEFEGKEAAECLPILLAAIDEMVAHPDEYKALNPPNGWGSYDSCLRYLRDIAAACERHRGSVVRVSR